MSVLMAIRRRVFRVLLVRLPCGSPLHQLIPTLTLVLRPKSSDPSDFLVLELDC